jgi:hypothetical protein
MGMPFWHVQWLLAIPLNIPFDTSVKLWAYLSNL